MLYKQILICKVMEDKKVRTTGKIDWYAKPLILVFRFTIYGSEDCRGKQITIKVEFNDEACNNRVVNEMTDRCYEVSFVKSYEVLAEESSDDYGKFFKTYGFKEDPDLKMPAFIVHTRDDFHCISIRPIRQEFK